MQGGNLNGAWVEDETQEKEDQSWAHHKMGDIRSQTTLGYRRWGHQRQMWEHEGGRELEVTLARAEAGIGHSWGVQGIGRGRDLLKERREAGAAPLDGEEAGRVPTSDGGEAAGTAPFPPPMKQQ